MERLALWRHGKVNQRSSRPRANRFADFIASDLETQGETTSILNTTSPPEVVAVWREAAIGTIQHYLSPEEWQATVYEVEFPVSVTASPYNLRIGDEVRCETIEARASVRALIPLFTAGVAYVVRAICVLLPDN